MPELEEVAQFEALREDWAALWARIPDATPFQHPAWLVPWARHMRDGRALVFAMREGGTPVALLPFWLHRDRLFPLGIGTTDYLDVLVAPGQAAAALGALMRRLPQLGLRIADWPQLRPGSPLLTGRPPPGWRDATEPAEPCPVLELPGQVSAKTRRDLRTARRRAAEAGMTVEDATPGTTEAFLEALFRLHAARWEGQGQSGVLAAPEVQAMHRDAAPSLLQAGLLRLIGLRRAGEVVAVVHALADPPGRARRILYLYLQGFDPALARLSPGLLLVGEAVERAMDEGFDAVDFLRGQERYKRFWGAADTPTFRRLLRPAEA